MTLTKERLKELEGMMWGDSSSIDTKTLVEYTVPGDVVAVDFIKRQLTVSTDDGGVGYESFGFKQEQEREIRSHLRLCAPVELTVWKYVAGSLDDGLWMRSFEQAIAD